MTILGYEFSMNFVHLLLAFTTSVFVSLFSIPVIIQVANTKSLMDEPNQRSSHSNKIPRLGGLAIFASVLLSFAVWGHFAIDKLQYVIGSLVILFFTGLKDDVFSISPMAKLSAQIAASAIVVIGSGVQISSFFGLAGIYSIPDWLSLGVTIFIFVVINNAFNLIDGIDGLAGGLGIISTSFFGWYFYETNHIALAILAAALVGALAGFLRFNFDKNRKIFMGDTGSLLMGFIVSVFVIKFIQINESPVYTPNYIANAPIIAILVLIIPLFDTLRVFLIRILNGRSPFSPDRNHIHHILIDKNLTHLQASIVLYITNILIIIAGVTLFQYCSISISTLILLSLFVLFIALFHKNRPKQKSQ